MTSPEEYSEVESQDDQVDEVVEAFIDQIEHTAREQDLSEAQKAALYQGVIERVASHLDEMDAQVQAQRLYQAVARTLVSFDQGGSEESDYFVEHQREAFFSGEEPIDSLYAIDEFGFAQLDPDYLPAVFREALAELPIDPEIELPEDLLSILPLIGRLRKQLLFQLEDPATRVSTGPRNVPPLDILRGDLGVEASEEFAKGALDALERIAESIASEADS